jgi:hypothetical protein
MTAATRKTATVANSGDRSGTNYLIGVDTEVEALWKVSWGFLIGVGGTGNAITATSDTALVAAITSYARPMGFYYVPIAANTTAVSMNIDAVGILNVYDKNGAVLQGGEFAIGTIYPLVYDGTNLRAITVAAGSANTVSTAPDVIVQDQKSSGTNGGTFTSGAWRTRDLTTLVRNNNSLASLASNQVTLPAGTYYAEWSSTAFDVNVNQSRLYNATDGSLIAYGTTSYAYTGAGPGERTRGSAVFTITSSKAIELDHQCQTTRSTNGMGGAGGFGNIEVYSEMRIWKQ